MRATVIAIIVILVSAGLVGLAIVYTSMARGPLIRIRILDEKGRPIEGALVQAFAITCPGSSTPAVEVLREKTGFNGAVVLKLEGEFEEVVRRWREYLDRVYEGRSKRFFTAIELFIIYQDQKGLYLSCGETVLYSPGALLEGARYNKVITLDLSRGPRISMEELSARIASSSHSPGREERPGLLWVLEDWRTWPPPGSSGLGYAKIPVAWSDSRGDEEAGVYGLFHVEFAAGVKGKVGVRAGGCFGMDVAALGVNADYEFQLAGFTVAEEDVGFDHSAPISRGKFVYIYTWAQVRYEEYQLYARPHPDVLAPLDVWWFETYVIDYELRDYDGDGVLDDIADGVEEVEELPDILSELGDGIAYELYNEYTGYGQPEFKWAYMVSGKEIEDKCIPSEVSGEYGLGISLGVVLASAIAHGELSGGLALPPSLMAVLTASWSVSGHADLGWCVFFDAPQGTQFRFYVGTTRLAFVLGHLEFKVPVLGIRWASA